MHSVSSTLKRNRIFGMDTLQIVSDECVTMEIPNRTRMIWNIYYKRIRMYSANLVHSFGWIVELSYTRVEELEMLTVRIYFSCSTGDFQRWRNPTSRSFRLRKIPDWKCRETPYITEQMESKENTFFSVFSKPYRYFLSLYFQNTFIETTKWKQ